MMEEKPRFAKNVRDPFTGELKDGDLIAELRKFDEKLQTLGLLSIPPAVPVELAAEA